MRTVLSRNPRNDTLEFLMEDAGKYQILATHLLRVVATLVRQVPRNDVRQREQDDQAANEADGDRDFCVLGGDYACCILGSGTSLRFAYCYGYADVN